MREWLAAATPEVDSRVEEGIALVAPERSPETVLLAGYAVALVGAALGLTLVALGHRVPGAVLVVLAGVVPLGLPAGLRTVATAARRRALGTAPALVSRAVLRMRLSPTVEGAAAFAARNGQGPLADSLAAYVRRARGTPGSGVGAFAEHWGRSFPALRRAWLLVTAAADTPSAARDRPLDRAMRAVLDGTRDRTAEQAAALKPPVTALYAFGVLLPLALVAVLPAARVAGMAVGVRTLVALYDLLLPLTVLAASVWLLARRPVVFPSAPVPADHPAVPDARWLWLPMGVVAGLGCAAVGWFVPTVPAWTVPLLAVGCGAGVALVGWGYGPVQVRRRVRAVERGLPDALALVGRRVGDGVAVETAVERVAEDLDAGHPVAEPFAAAARRQRTLRVGVGEAFCGPDGALATLPSPRTRSTMRLVALAAREGRPAGRAVVAMADHLEELGRVERETRRTVQRVTTTLSHTAAVFAPLVAGVTVGLSTAMGGALGSDPLPTATLGLAVGAYVLVLAPLLTALAVGLERGVDPATVAYRSGLALCSGTALTLVSFLAVRTVT